MYVDLLPGLVFGLVWLGVVAVLRLKNKDNVVFLVFFTIFYVYLYKVLDYTLFQFQSLLLLKYVMPGLMLNGLAAEKSLNLMPLVTLTAEDLKTSLLNILMLVPFGFGLPFITRFRMQETVIIGALFSVAIELLQLLTGYVANISFRIADINDVIFNTVGVMIGYGLFFAFVSIYRRRVSNWAISAHPVLRYFAERPQIQKHPL